MKKIVKRTLKISAISLSSIVGLLLITIAVVMILLTPARLTPIVNTYCDEFLNAEVRFDTVKLSLFDDLPYIGLKISGGEVVSHKFRGHSDSLRAMIPARADSLLSFKELVVSLNVSELLIGKIGIRRIKLSKPQIYAYVSPWGEANWDILKLDMTDTVESEEPPLDIKIRRITIRDRGVLVYDDRKEDIKAEIDFNKITLRGVLTPDLAQMELERVRMSKVGLSVNLGKENLTTKVVVDTLGIEFEKDRKKYNIIFDSHSTLIQNGMTYCENLPFAISGGIVYDRGNAREFVLENMISSVADVPITLDGKVRIDGDSIYSDINSRVDAFSLSKLLSHISEDIVPGISNLKTDIALKFNTRIKGSYKSESGEMPSVVLDFSVPKGYLSSDGVTARLDNVEIDGSLRYNPSRLDSTGVVLKKLSVEGVGIKIEASGSAWDVLRNPAVDGRVNGSVNLTKLSELFPPREGAVIRGTVGVDLKGKFKMNDLTLANIGKTKIRGKLKFDSLYVDLPNDSIRLTADGTSLSIGSTENKRDTLMQKGLEIVRVSLRSDTMNINYRNEFTAVVSKIKVSMQSAAAAFNGQQGEVHPFTGKTSANRIDLTDIDGSRLRLRELNCNFSIVPSPIDNSIPLLKLDIKSKRLNMSSTVNRYSLVNSNILLSLTMNKVNKERRERRLDSLQRIYPTVQRDSLMAHNKKVRQVGKKKDEFGYADLDLSVDKSMWGLMNRWKVSGEIKAQRGRVVTPYFPLKNRFKDVDLTFDMNQVSLNNTTVLSGRSQMQLTGKVSGIKRVLQGKGKLKVEMDLISDTLNVNELVQAYNAGLIYGATSDEYKESLANAENEEQLQELIAENSGSIENQSPLLIVPANLNMDIRLDVKQGYYANLTLDKVAGELLVRNRCLQIKDFNAVTDAGEVMLTALYSTQDLDNLTVGFDLELKSIEVHKLIDLIPDIDTIMPMLRSFEGVLNCGVAATARIDEQMNIIPSSLKAACKLTGNNLVLLDGETFAEISKMLMFKNKKKNMIDNISIELLIEDSKINMFPFVLEMDRYRAAVGGIHNLDMSFKYHISVLKSPIPFNLGVTVTGSINDLDNIKYKIGKAHLKNLDKPLYVGVVDTTRLNLRKQINDIVQKGLKAATLSSSAVTPKVNAEAIIGKDEELTPEEKEFLKNKEATEVSENIEVK